MIGKPTCDDLADLYLTKNEFVNRFSRDAQERCLRRSLAVFGKIRPVKITPDDVLSYVETRRELVKDGTIKRELGAFETALRFASRMHRITSDEIPVFPKLRDQSKRLVYLSASQRQVFEGRLAAAPLDIRGFGMIGLVFGARAGAITDLTVDRVGRYVDFKVPGRGETRKRRSVNKVPGSMVALMAELKLAGGRRLLPGGAAGRFARWCLTQKWPTGFPRVTPHVLRHTCATLMLDRGATIWDVSRWLNETPDTIEAHYGHFTEEAQDRLAALAE